MELFRHFEFLICFSFYLQKTNTMYITGSYVVYYISSYLGTSQDLLFQDYNIYILRYISCSLEDREQL